MLDLILAQAQKMEFDFRAVAYPSDPLQHLFREWVDYYKLKAAIARILQPKSILEIGVRFGYSAAAFLYGSPEATYVGIDNDSESFGGVRSATDWARKILPTGQTQLIIGDSQALTRFPGGIYDLIHVDGQQNGDGTYHDMELAVKQGRVVLVDGYHWSTANFHAINDFLFRYRDVIEFYGVIPGYAGELLIKVSPSFLDSTASLPSGKPVDSVPLRNSYTVQYYLHDCGGWDSFQQHHGRHITDCRLGCMMTLALLKTPMRLLDLGCGRGELVYAAATRGVAVTAIDYSADAIAIAKNVFSGNEPCASNVEWICNNVITAPLTGTYDAAVASDLIEHMAPAEVDTLYAKMASRLPTHGLFIVHTYPNRWYYQYDYARRRRIAASVGAYLPADPRSRYEKLMHINEQSPRILLRQLRRHFKHVLLWFATPQDPLGSLARRFSRRELAASPNLYAIASHEPITADDVAKLLKTNPIPVDETYKIFIELQKCPVSVARGSQFEINVKIVNGSKITLCSFPPVPVYIAYHWVDVESGSVAVYDGIRSPLLPAAPEWSTCDYRAVVSAPTTAGVMKLQIRLVQEGVSWFEGH